MDVFDAVRTRRSVRRFKPEPVPEDDLRSIVELATRAPNASNRQMWKFLAITNAELLDEMRDAILRKIDVLMERPEAQEYREQLESAKEYSTFFVDAPATIVVLGEPYKSAIDEVLRKEDLKQPEIDALRQRPDIQSIGAAIGYLCLIAHALGYGTCWMSAPTIAGPELKTLLDLQPPWEIIAFVPIGIPDEQPPARDRKPVEEVMEFIR